jgi:transcriptional regulator with XRE-family HTH domain/Zn-dependent peptidase ImmA (M78 family)
MGKRKTYTEKEIAVRVGARIRKLREIQHITQTKLAEDIGIRAGPLGWIEKGKHLPSGRVLYRIAKRLNVKIDDLFHEQDLWETMQAKGKDGDASFLLPPVCDSKKAADAEAVKLAHIACQATAQAALDLESLCGVPHCSDMPTHQPFAATEAGAECMAGSVRRSLGVGDAIIRDYIELLEDAGALAVFADMPLECASFSGYGLSSRKVFIFLNARYKKCVELNLYRMAFELGRILWSLQKDREEAGSAKLAAGAEELDEIGFARRFATHFLMPAAALTKIVGRLGLTPDNWTWELLLMVKKRFGVSARHLAVRLHELGLTHCPKRSRNAAQYCFLDEITAFEAAHGAGAEPDALRARFIMNRRLSELVLVAGRQPAGKPKKLAAAKRILRQSGIKLEA